MTVHDELVYALSTRGSRMDVRTMEALMLEAAALGGRTCRWRGSSKIMRRYGVAGSSLAIAKAP